MKGYHRFVNASNSPALLLCGTTAPNVMNLYDDMAFIFECPFSFTSRFAGTQGFTHAATPVVGLWSPE